jgi:hypothetical protein
MDDMKMVDAPPQRAVERVPQAGDEDMEVEIDINESAELVSCLLKLVKTC